MRGKGMAYFLTKVSKIKLMVTKPETAIPMTTMMIAGRSIVYASFFVLSWVSRLLMTRTTVQTTTVTKLGS